MSAFRHPDLDRPGLSVRQLKALQAVIERYLPTDVHLTELEVLATPPNSGNPAPLEVRATIAEPEGGSRAPSWGAGLIDEVRRGWPPTDFLFSLQITEGLPDLDAPPGLTGL